MFSTLLIRFGGLVSLVFGGVHIFMGDLMDWQTQLSILSERNWAVVHLLNYGTAYLLFTLAYLSLRYAEEMTETSMGRTVCILAGTFWLLRAVGRVALGGLLKAQGLLLPGFYLLLFACYAVALVRTRRG